MATIRLRVTRALWFHGLSHPAGATLDVSAHDAAALLDSGRATLAEPADVAAVNIARREDLDAAIRIARRHVVESAPEPFWTPRRVA